MNARKSEQIRKEVYTALRKHPGEINGRQVYQMAKRDYLATPRNQRAAFSIFEPQTTPNT